MAVDILVECGEEEHLVRLLPDDVVWPDGSHDVDLEEALVEMGAPRCQCLVLRRAWLGLRKSWVFQRVEPFPRIAPFAPLSEVAYTGRASAYKRNEALALLLADFLEHALQQLSNPPEQLIPAYAVITNVRNQVFHRQTTSTASLRTATAAARRAAEAHISTSPSICAAEAAYRAANQIGLFMIDALSQRHVPVLHKLVAHQGAPPLAHRNILSALWHQARTKGTALDLLRRHLIAETIWQRHHALRVYEAMIEGKPWPST